MYTGDTGEQTSCSPLNDSWCTLSKICRKCKKKIWTCILKFSVVFFVCVLNTVGVTASALLLFGGPGAFVQVLVTCSSHQLGWMYTGLVLSMSHDGMQVT